MATMVPGAKERIQSEMKVIDDHNKVIYDKLDDLKAWKASIKSAEDITGIIPFGLEWLGEYFHNGLAVYHPNKKMLDLSGVMSQPNMSVEQWIEIDSKVKEWMTTLKWSQPGNYREEFGEYILSTPTVRTMTARFINSEIEKYRKCIKIYEEIDGYSEYISEYRREAARSAAAAQYAAKKQSKDRIEGPKSERYRKYWESLTKEQQDAKMNHLRSAKRENLSSGIQAYWDTLTPEQRSERQRRKKK